jgi:hypothetical protein
VKADTGEAIKTLLDEKAQESSAQLEERTGLELLKDVLESYPAEMFYAASLDPKIYLDENKKPYVIINQKFNEDLFWKEFLPKLRTALDGIALKKEKRTYESAVRQANQKLAKERHAVGVGIYSNRSINDKYGVKVPYNTTAPYSWAGKKEEGFFPTGGFLREQKEENPLFVIIPDNEDEYTVYQMPCEVTLGLYSELPTTANYGQFPDLKYFTQWRGTFVRSKAFLLSGIVTPTNDDSYRVFGEYTERASLPATFSITYLDNEGYDITTQVIPIGPVMAGIYRSYYTSNLAITATILNPLFNAFAFGPGFVNETESDVRWLFDFFLDTTNFEKKYSVVLDEDDLQKVDSMRFEYGFENK